MLSRHILVAKCFCFFLCRIDNLRELATETRLRIALLRVATGFEFGCSAKRCDVRTHALENGHDNPLVLNKQGEEEMKVVHEWIARFAREAYRIIERFGALHRQTV